MRLDHHNFEFGQGITFLCGDNGQGKTTCINAILFALYGPTAVTCNKDDMITYGEANGFVELEFIHEKESIIIKRPFKGKVEITAGDHKITGNKEVELFIKNHFGDSSIFLLSHIAQQESISAITKLEPRIRKQVFSDICGLNIIDSAIGLLGTINLSSPISDTVISEKDKEIEKLKETISKIDLQKVTKYQQLKQKLAIASEYEKETIQKEIKELQEMQTSINDKIKQDRWAEEFYSAAVRTAKQAQQGKDTCVLCEQKLNNPEEITKKWQTHLDELQKRQTKLRNELMPIPGKISALQSTLTKPLRHDIEEELQEIGEQISYNEVSSIQQRLGSAQTESIQLKKTRNDYQIMSEKKIMRDALKEFRSFMLQDMLRNIEKEASYALTILTSDWNDPIESVTIDPETINIMINGKTIKSRSTGQCNIICTIIRFCICSYWNAIQGKLNKPFIVMDSPFDSLSDTNFDKIINAIQSISREFEQIIITSHRITDNPGDWSIIEIS